MTVSKRGVHIGCVAIGRNEGERLRVSLESACRSFDLTVYVDSGSTDDSVAIAEGLGCEVVRLDLSTPFTAGRARTEGCERLLKHLPGLEFVQFIDGDCEIRTDWGRHAVDALKADDSLAVVCGRRRERRPDASIYNQLCDIEWDTGVGEALACGGDAMMRVRAFRGVGGFDPTVIAGEEPELCVRLRRDGWKIRRIDAEMTLHDADITHFSQWWKRARRSGFAYGLGYLMHGQPPERHWRSECIRIAFWGATLPLAALLLGWLVSPWAILILPVGYAISGWRVFRATRSVRPSLPARAAAWYATFTLIGRVPELIGLVQCLVGQVLKKERRIIEYK